MFLVLRLGGILVLNFFYPVKMSDMKVTFVYFIFPKMTKNVYYPAKKGLHFPNAFI